MIKGLEDSVNNGPIAGFPVVDLRATLIDGSYHDVDSSALAFEIAARACFREGVKKAGPKLLEPVMKVQVTTPEDHMGDVIGDINSRRGQVGELGEAGLNKTVNAMVPLSEMFQYVSKLRGMTKGRAAYTMELDSYQVVPPHVEAKVVGQYGAKAAAE